MFTHIFKTGSHTIVQTRLIAFQRQNIIRPPRSDFFAMAVWVPMASIVTICPLILIRSSIPVL